MLHLGPASVQALLAVWALWQADARRCDRLHLVAAPADLPEDDGSPCAADLRRHWPVAAPGWHAVSVDGHRVHWLLGIAQPDDAWTRLVLRADAVLGAPAGGWTASSARAVSRLVAAGAHLHLAPCDDARADGVRRAALRSAGFLPDALDGATDQAGATLTLRHRPHPAAKRPASRGIADSAGEPGRILIVGGGLAGCAVAAALAELGRASTVVDRHAHAAAEASGNPAGLFHGIVTPEDGLHARYHRAAALDTQRSVARAIAEDGVAGGISGLLRLQRPAPDARSASVPSTLADMRDVLSRQRLPPSYVEALDPAAASARAGLRIDVPAWWFPGGGWVDPAALARAMLRRAGGLVTWRGEVRVATLRRRDGLWALCDAAGDEIDAAPTVVLANAADAHRLLDRPDWPLQRLRGQLSSAPAGVLPDLQPAVPMAGAGYVLPRVGGQLLFGATSHPEDDDALLRTADHVANLRRLRDLTGWRSDAVAPEALAGRTAWRWSADDRMPLVGAVPAASAEAGPGRPPDQPRHVTRVPGLYLHTALGGRGITWSSLGGRLLAAIVAGTPLPLASDLVDAVDPARYAARAARRANRPPGGPPADGGTRR